MPAASVSVFSESVSQAPVSDVDSLGPASPVVETAVPGSEVSAAVDGALAVAPVPEGEAVPPAFAGPLVELVVAEEPKPRIPRPLGIFLAVLLVATAAGGWVVFGPGGGSALASHYARVYKVGEVHNYTMTVGMRGSMSGPVNLPVDVTMNADVSERVLAVAPDKTSTVRFDVSFASLEANGQRMAVPGKMSITARVAEDGRVLSVEGSEGFGAAGGANPLSGFWGGPESMQPVFPNGKVAPGDTWTTKFTQKLPFGDKRLTLTAKNKLLRLGTEHGMKVAEIRSIMEMPMNFEFTGKDLQKMSGFAGGGNMPADAGISFKGKMTFDAIQTVVRETGRPIAVTGEGLFDVTMGLSGAGAPAGAAIKMNMSVDISFAEVFGQAA